MTAHTPPGTDTLVDTTTTDAGGNYSFSGVYNGNYVIHVPDAANDLPLLTDQAWVQTAETDTTVNNGLGITVSSGDVSGSHDFGYQKQSTSDIGNTLYQDYDGDGTQDAGEPGIPSITVWLYEDLDMDGVYDPGFDQLVDTQATDGSGNYLFEDNDAGNYLVIVDTSDPDFPAGLAQTGDPDEAGTCAVCDSMSTVTVDGINDQLDEDFGYRYSGLIGDTIYYDADQDGQQDWSEIGVPGVTVNLEDSGGVTSSARPSPMPMATMSSAACRTATTQLSFRRRLPPSVATRMPPPPTRMAMAIWTATPTAMASSPVIWKARGLSAVTTSMMSLLSLAQPTPVRTSATSRQASSATPSGTMLTATAFRTPARPVSRT